MRSGFYLLNHSILQQGVVCSPLSLFVVPLTVPFFLTSFFIFYHKGDKAVKVSPKEGRQTVEKFVDNYFFPPFVAILPTFCRRLGDFFPCFVAFA
jgi:hypothetical protein